MSFSRRSDSKSHIPFLTYTVHHGTHAIPSHSSPSQLHTPSLPPSTYITMTCNGCCVHCPPSCAKLSLSELTDIVQTVSLIYCMDLPLCMLTFLPCWFFFTSFSAFCIFFFSFCIYVLPSRIFTPLYKLLLINENNCS